ncbi:non-ribosomal peptide synthetase module [Paenibacillus caui]|uniref:non-ribosomal peptide synthetase module n=1 Tax=Paenibacillus caui TaxID=2873927 RepID=UPI001CA9F133|nr:non-ribosomal peptide synthetase module [Paenibacillus caui]
MAKRIATEYVKATMRMSEAQMSEFVRKVYDPHVCQQVKVLEGGGQEVVLLDRDGEELHVAFDCKDGFYVCECSFRLKNPRLTNVMRRMFAEFKGCGLVYRIYEGFVMEYSYEEGRVIKIAEQKADACKLVYQYKNTLGELRSLFELKLIEAEIDQIRKEINALLELRMANVSGDTVDWVDKELRRNSQRLFALEA